MNLGEDVFVFAIVSDFKSFPFRWTQLDFNLTQRIIHLLQKPTGRPKIFQDGMNGAL